MSDEGIGTVAVIGAGAMGAGIAQVFAERDLKPDFSIHIPKALNEA